MASRKETLWWLQAGLPPDMSITEVEHDGSPDFVWYKVIYQDVVFGTYFKEDNVNLVKLAILKMIEINQGSKAVKAEDLF